MAKLNDNAANYTNIMYNLFSFRVNSGIHKIMSDTKNYILDQPTAEKKMRRMALEIVENNPGESEIILAGIRESGSVIARNIQQLIPNLSSLKTELITLTLDKHLPNEVILSKTMDFNNKVIILIDDVANSGKTLLYALKPFLVYHPKKIQTLVLVERSHNSFPVRPDYIGLSIATTLKEHIFVEVNGDKVLGAYME
jgi:pyrimidine operon attenuation protein / uracil phosphoribosyltransferase